MTIEYLSCVAAFLESESGAPCAQSSVIEAGAYSPAIGVVSSQTFIEVGACFCDFHRPHYRTGGEIGDFKLVVVGVFH